MQAVDLPMQAPVWALAAAGSAGSNATSSWLRSIDIEPQAEDSASLCFAETAQNVEHAEESEEQLAYVSGRQSSPDARQEEEEEEEERALAGTRLEVWQEDDQHIDLFLQQHAESEAHSGSQPEGRSSQADAVTSTPAKAMRTAASPLQVCP